MSDDLIKLKLLDWSELDPFYLDKTLEKIQTLLNLKHSEHLNQETISLRLSYHPSQFQVESILTHHQEKRLHIIQGIVPLPQEDFNNTQIADRLLDFADTFWFQYFEFDRNVYLNLDWSPYDMDGLTIFARGGVHYPELEAWVNEKLKDYDDVYPVSMEL